MWWKFDAGVAKEILRQLREIGDRLLFVGRAGARLVDLSNELITHADTSLIQAYLPPKQEFPAPGALQPQSIHRLTDGLPIAFLPPSIRGGAKCDD